MAVNTNVLVETWNHVTSRTLSVGRDAEQARRDLVSLNTHISRDSTIHHRTQQNALTPTLRQEPHSGTAHEMLCHKLNIARARLLSLERSAYKGGPWHVGSSILGLSCANENGSLGLKCLQKEYSLCQTPAILLKSGIQAGRGCFGH